MYVTQQLHSIDITTTINHVTPSPSLLQFTVTKEFWNELGTFSCFLFSVFFIFYFSLSDSLIIFQESFFFDVPYWLNV